MPTPAQITALVANALAEDIGAGDVTTQAVIDSATTATAVMLAKARGVLCGIDVAREAFRQVDPTIVFNAKLADGATLAGEREVIAEIHGPAAGILMGERVALNFLQRMSGIATVSALYAAAVRDTNARVVDTRKTTPGLRVLEKYAVRVGGAFNHRYGLSDGILIKDNHIAAAGSITEAVRRAKANAHHLLKIEVEAKQIEQVQEALAAGADVIMLDNMDHATMRMAVALIGRQAITEASGGVTLATITEIAFTGVDLISVGALTHSAPSLDISLDITVQ
ncbi:MAG TPA: carboxylating nicotinate-nucleotide diphosphorylase [Capsulimonadaceae bacterium]|jgi:nicotinate-nucleotide pyrophosphorylase (carboxylating)